MNNAIMDIIVILWQIAANMDAQKMNNAIMDIIVILWQKVAREDVQKTVIVESESIAIQSKKNVLLSKETSVHSPN